MNNSNDPLTVLHGDELPVQPDPAFAARLRSRLESALSLPNRTEGVVMSGTETAIAELSEPTVETAVAEPAPRSAAIPYLSVANARDAIAWYVDAFGASVVGEPIAMDDGRIGHAELAIAGGVLYLADEYPELGLKAPDPQACSVSLMLHVADTDAALGRARERGARVEREVYENYGARNATIVDPFGHRWMLSGPMTGAVTPIQHGDVGYVSVWTADPDRAAAFYGQVLGWTYDPSTHQVTNTKQPIGIYRRREPTDAVLLLCGRRPGGRQAGDRGRRRTTRRGPAVRLRHRAGRHRPAGHGVRRVPACWKPDPSARAQWRRAGRTFVHHLRGCGLGRVQVVLQPGAVLDVRTGSRRGRLAGAGHPPDGRRRRRQFQPGDGADVDGRRHRRRGRHGFARPAARSSRSRRNSRTG